MRIKIEITDYDKNNTQTLGLELNIYHIDEYEARELAKRLIDATSTRSED